MTDYSELVVIVWMLPVLQIIIPLLMLIGFGVVCSVRALFRGLKVKEDYVNIYQKNYS